ncbi:MAG: hypothetical protein GXY05_11095, partial [Clostridiales bacterium]|nr:hypothetical protein [Clostridiales bacterium]
MGQTEKDEIKKIMTAETDGGDKLSQETAAAQGYDVPEEPRKRGRKGWIIGVSVLLVIAVVLIAGRA